MMPRFSWTERCRVTCATRTSILLQLIAIALGLVLLCAPTAAHQASDGYLTLTVSQQQLSGRLDLALRDLEICFGLDADGDGAVTWGEVKASQVRMASYLATNLTLSIDGKLLSIPFDNLAIDEHDVGSHAVWQWSLPLPPHIAKLDVTYHCLFEVDALHRGFVKVTKDELTKTAMFSPDQPSHTILVSESGPQLDHGWMSFLREGVVHIWTGYDHVLFLLALLLPAVMVRSENHWRGADALRPSLWKVLKIVTAFTVAHSLTLTLAVLGWVQLPSRWVESVIAASVVVAALNNLKPWFQERGWIVTFIFGLVHGFGFAGVLAEMQIQGSALVWSLVGFNLGVELGQAAIVAVFVPIAFGLRHTPLYLRGGLQAGSVAIAMLASVWLYERLVG